MKLTLSLVMAVLIGLCAIPVGAQMDESAGTKQQVRWVAPFEFTRITDEDGADGTYAYHGNLELWDVWMDHDADYRAQFRLPDGAKIVRAQWYVYDNCQESATDDSVDDNIFVELARVKPDCGDNPFKEPICKALSQDKPRYVCVDCDFVSDEKKAIVNNQKYYYLAVVKFNTESCSDRDMRFIGLKIFYRLRVSKAPATATFHDVPTTYWAFKYIEALADSGITDGCGGGNYCPDSYVTRAQMAKFLSMGWGLYHN